MNVSKVTEKDFHMGDSMRLFDILATDRIDRVVLNAEHGPMGATEVTWWNSKIGLILEKHSSNGGESLIIHPASATTCPGHGRSECVSCCWPKGTWNGLGLPPVGLPVEAYFPQDTQPVWLETTLLYISDENVIYDDPGMGEIRKTRAEFDDLNVQFRAVQR